MSAFNDVSFLAPQSRLMLLLTEKRQAMLHSSASYDQGNLWEAKRLANEIAMLVHDPVRGRSKSLLTQLGCKADLRFHDTCANHPAMVRDGEIFPPSGLLGLAGDANGWRIVPSCQLSEMPSDWSEDQKFRFWWEESVTRFVGRANLSRKNLVMSARDQDGGAHVDGVLELKSYADFAFDAASSARVNGQPLPNAHLACIRQIAWELMQTLDDAFGRLS
jgi:hypothetical protein